MKVKELIKALKGQHPEREVYIPIHARDFAVSGVYQGATVDSLGQKRVYIGGQP